MYAQSLALRDDAILSVVLGTASKDDFRALDDRVRNVKRGWGRIIHISGRDGFFTVPYRAHNVTCKAGLHSLAKAIALEFGEYGVTANTIAPGKVDTVARDEKHYPGYKERWAEAAKTMPLRRVATSEDILKFSEF